MVLDNGLLHSLLSSKAAAESEAQKLKSVLSKNGHSTDKIEVMPYDKWMKG